MGAGAQPEPGVEDLRSHAGEALAGKGRARPGDYAKASVCPQRSLLWSLLGDLGTFGSWSLSLSWRRSCNGSQDLALNLDLGLWPAEPEILGGTPGS